ncbi:unnamed protein product [Ectocarpus fasciculatus]
MTDRQTDRQTERQSQTLGQGDPDKRGRIKNWEEEESEREGGGQADEDGWVPLFGCDRCLSMLHTSISLFRGTSDACRLCSVAVERWRQRGRPFGSCGVGNSVRFPQRIGQVLGTCYVF